MALPVKLTGRELVVFAERLRQSYPGSAGSDSIPANTASNLNWLANGLLAEEAREAIKAEGEAAAANVAATLRTCCDLGGSDEMAEHGFEPFATLRTVEPPPQIVINVHGVTDPEAVSVAIAESMERRTRRKNMERT
jgi:hypothetical protein